MRRMMLCQLMKMLPLVEHSDSTQSQARSRKSYTVGFKLAAVAKFDELHSKLNALMTDDTATCEEPKVGDEPSGLTDMQ